MRARIQPLIAAAALVLGVLSCGSRTDVTVDTDTQEIPGPPVGSPDASQGPDDATTSQAHDVTSDKPSVDATHDSAPDAPAVVEGGSDCVNACADGETECLAGGIATCTIAADGCEAWGTAVECAAGQTCVKQDATRASCFSPLIAAPRPVAPLSTATVTSQSPVFRWALAQGDDGAEVEICRDRACTLTVTIFTATGASGAPAIVLSAGLYYWRLRGTAEGAVGNPSSTVWEFTVGARSAPINTSWGTTLDVNGDGFADVAVGAFEANAGAGAVYLYLGGATGLSITPTMIAAPDGGFFGYALASAGDVNGDGFADLVVGAYAVGAAYLYLGSAMGLSTTAIPIASPLAATEDLFGYSVAGPGDINGDGYADVVIGARGDAGGETAGSAYVFFGSATGLSTAATTLASPVPFGGDFAGMAARAGDINGDGFADIVLGANGANDNRGASYVYWGSPQGPSTVPTAVDNPSDNTAEFTVLSVGDVNGDGFADVMTEAFLDVDTDNFYVYLGSATGLSAVPSLLQGEGNACLGDVNGDGFADLVVVSSGAFEAAGVSIYFGSPAGLSTSATPVAVPDTEPLLDSPTWAGDVNGDGFADILLEGTPSDGAAAVYVYSGSAGGLSSPPAVIDGPGGVLFGSALASADDVLLDTARESP